MFNAQLTTVLYRFVNLLDGFESNRVGVSLLPPEDGNRLCFRSVVFSSCSEFWTTDKVHKPSDSVCYTQSSEPFIVYCHKVYYLKFRVNATEFALKVH
jgi:hypothetical protein